MFQRVIQLAARTLAAALVSVAGFFLGKELDPDQVAHANEIAAGVAAALGAVALFLVDLLIHRAGAGKIMAPPGEREPASGHSFRAPSLGLLLCAGAALGMTVLVGGCVAPRSVPAEEFDPLLTRVLDFAEPRIATEPGLPEPDRKGLLMDAAILRRAFDAALQRDPSPTVFESLYPALGPASPDG